VGFAAVFLEAVGMVKGSSSNQRIKEAATTANTSASIHSRKADFFGLVLLIG
jgi:hypothetical protein